MSAQLPEDFMCDIARRHDAIVTGSAYASALKAAKIYVEARHPKCTTAFVTGSYYDSVQTRFSDVDVYVIDERIPTPLREHIMVGGYPLQVGIMSTFSLLEAISDLSLEGSLFMPPMAFSRGVHIFGDSAVFTRILKRANAIIAAGPPPRNADTLRFYRTRLIAAYVKLFRDHEFPRRYSIVDEAVKAGIDYVNIESKEWNVSRIGMGQTLSEINDIIRSVSMALDGNYSHLRNSLCNILESRGPLKWDTYNEGLISFFD